MGCVLTFPAVPAAQCCSSPASTVEWRHCEGEGGAVVREGDEGGVVTEGKGGSVGKEWREGVW